MNSTKHRGLLALPPQSIDEAGKAELIEASGWSKGFEWKEVLRLAKYFDLHQCPLNFEVVAEGDSGTFMALIAEGKVRVLKRSAAGEAKEIVTLQQGSTFGELCLFDAQPRSATIVTAVPCKLLSLPQARFAIMLKQEPDLCARLLIKIAKAMSNMLRQASGRLVDFLQLHD